MTPISWVVLGAVAALGVVFLAAALALFPVEVSVGALAAAVAASWCEPCPPVERTRNAPSA